MHSLRNIWCLAFPYPYPIPSHYFLTWLSCEMMSIITKRLKLIVYLPVTMALKSAIASFHPVELTSLVKVLLNCISYMHILAIYFFFSRFGRRFGDGEVCLYPPTIWTPWPVGRRRQQSEKEKQDKSVIKIATITVQANRPYFLWLP